MKILSPGFEGKPQLPHFKSPPCLDLHTLYYLCPTPFPTHLMAQSLALQSFILISLPEGKGATFPSKRPLLFIFISFLTPERLSEQINPLIILWIYCQLNLCSVWPSHHPGAICRHQLQANNEAYSSSSCLRKHGVWNKRIGRYLALWFYFKRIKKILPHVGAYLQHELIFLTNKINHSTLLGPVGNVDPSRLLGAFSSTANFRFFH